MKKLFVILVMIGITSVVIAQQPYFPTKKGSILEYVSKDGKGKIIGYTRMTVKDITKTGASQTITMSNQSFDAKKTPQGEANVFKVSIMEDKIIFDPQAMFPQNIEATIEYAGKGNTIPTRMIVGDTWPDAEATMTMDMGFTKMVSTVKLTERKVLAKEKISVGAGTYECYKVQQIAIISTPMGSPMKQKHIMWYAEGLGHVKSEVYKENNQLISIEELNSIQ
ncbi:MAG: hypothetical protein RBS13_02365 [Bacteroidales bacterium]|jgi:hypothetical protein|nr:hypothetical protein [Bacteroidales bacterium]